MTPLDAQCIASLPVGPGAYVLLGTNGLHYTGSARNLRERLRDHRAGRASRTKNQRPLRLVHLEQSPDYRHAQTRERFLKSGRGRSWLRERQTVSP